jgi:hypothetical protein
MSSTILSDWHPEAEFARLLREKTGYGTEPTLYRWRQQNRVPNWLEWIRAGRAVMWREKPNPSVNTASPVRSSP